MGLGLAERYWKEERKEARPVIWGEGGLVVGALWRVEGEGTWMRAESEAGEGEERRWRGCLSVMLLCSW